MNSTEESIHSDCIDMYDGDIVHLSYPSSRVTEQLDVFYSNEYDYYVSDNYNEVVSIVQDTVRKNHTESKTTIANLKPREYMKNKCAEIESCVILPNGEISEEQSYFTILMIYLMLTIQL